MGRSLRDSIRTRLTDGIDFLPTCAGVYCILNRVNGKHYVGQAENIHRRCVVHRGELSQETAANFLMRRDAEVNGFDAFFFVLAVDVDIEAAQRWSANSTEIWWTVQLQAHDERFGYNLEAGHRRTAGALFRDRERKLMRANSGKYELLQGVDMYDPINPMLLATWIRGG